MFQLIAADLREFVAAVQDDTKTVVNIVRQDAMGTLDQLDEAILVRLTSNTAAAVPLSEAEREAKFRTTIREVYSTPLPSCAGGNGGGADEEEENEVTATAATAGMNDRMRAFEAREMEKFLATFRIDDQTDEIGRLLRRNERLREIFSDLVPIEVTYEEFWRRHYYRCDAGRIQRAWDEVANLSFGGETNLATALTKKISGAIAAPVRLLTLQRPRSALRKLAGGTSPPPVEPPLPLKTTEEAQSSPDKLLQDAKNDIAMMQSALSISNNRIAALRVSVEELQNDLRATRGTNAELTIEVALLKKQLQQRDDCIKHLEDQFIAQLDVSQQSTDASPSSVVGAINKPSGRRPLDASTRTETTDSNSTTTSADNDQHIGTCVTVLPATTTTTTGAAASSGKQSGKRLSTRTALWNLAMYGTWGGSNDDSFESESSAPEGWSSYTEEDDDTIADPLIHFLADN